ncbi:MAG: hypothetical protein LC656_04695, partial [Sphingomonadales bacterium]|nr:hypothetical protein [Sphingomonadales bacterium]
NLYRSLVLALTASSIVASPAVALPRLGVGAALAVPRSPWGTTQLALNERPRDQDRAFRATREGRSMPLPMIERRVLPFMGEADYLGPELKGDNYRLKFMQDGRVIWIDVDSATGRIVRRSGK